MGEYTVEETRDGYIKRTLKVAAKATHWEWSGPLVSSYLTSLCALDNDTPNNQLTRLIH